MATAKSANAKASAATASAAKSAGAKTCSTVTITENCPCLNPCPADAMFRLFGGKWKIKILCTLHYNEQLRYSDIKRMVTGISPTMLANSLRELEESGLVVRTIQDTMPVRVSYALSESAKSLIPILDTLRDWVVAHEPGLYNEV